MRSVYCAGHHYRGEGVGGAGGLRSVYCAGHHDRGEGWEGT